MKTYFKNLQNGDIRTQMRTFGVIMVVITLVSLFVLTPDKFFGK